MKTIIKLGSNMSYNLEIHAENDMEAIALKAWSERYFKEAIPDNNTDATLVYVFTIVKDNE